jgi:hypothetical protein
MRILTPVFFLVFALFFALFTPPAQALSLAPSVACCNEWAQTGIRPEICEPRQTEDVCEKELNQPEPNYLLACWPNESDTACRANVDAAIAQTRRDRERQPVDINNNGVINGELIRPVTQSATIFGALGFALGIGTTLSTLFLKHKLSKKEA